MNPKKFWLLLVAPPELHVSTLRREWTHLLVVFVLLFAVYAISAPRTIALEDDGLFVLSSYFLGNSHPPGYPLYTFFGNY